MVNFKRFLAQTILASLLVCVLGVQMAFAASIYAVTETTATVGTNAPLEIEYTVDTAQQTWADGDTLTLTFPNNFPQWSALTFTVENDGDVNNDGVNETAITAGAGNGQYTTSGRTITVKWDVTTWGAPNNGAETIRFLITAANAPTYADAASTFTFGGTTAAGGDTNPSGSDTVNVSADPLTATNVEPYVLTQSTLTTDVITLTTSIQIPSGGKISITYPSGFDLSSLGSTEAQRITNMTGVWTASVAGQTVTYTQSSGSATNAAALSFEVVPVRNPAVTGSAGTYTITTKDSSGNSLETDAAVSSDTIIAASVEEVTVGQASNISVTDAEDGNGVVITWTDPDDDTQAIQILRGISPDLVNGQPIVEIPVGLETYTDTEVEEGDIVTYQLRAVSDAYSGDLTDEVTFTVGSSADETDETDDSTDDSSDTDTTDEEDIPADDTDNTDDTDDAADDDTTLTDIEDHWAQAEIQAMVDAGIVEGNPDGSFDPDGNLNRAEAATLLWRVLNMGDPSEASEDPFSDVDMAEWYAAYIAGLKDLSLVEGNPDGTYEPSEEINRAEFLQLAMNVEEYLPHTDEGYDYDMELVLQEAYEDMSASEWYSATVALATVKGYVEGSACGEGMCFNPSSSITRAEATVILYRMFAEL
jgi:hypothetical protein